MNMLKKILIGSLLIFTLSANVFAENFVKDYTGKVLEVLSEEKNIIEFTGEEIKVQNLLVELNDGKKIELENDRIALEKGDNIFVKYQKDELGEGYTLEGIDRSWVILMLVISFIILVVWFGKKEGVKSLISLLASFLIIFFILIPLLLKGISPILIGIPMAILILFVAIFSTHGYNKESLVAVVSTSITIFLAAIVSYIVIKFGSLTGNFTEDTIYLDVETHGILDLRGLLFTGIIIGILGVLDDIAITQVSVVNEFKSLKEKISEKEIWNRAIKIGRHHVGALINTLVLAYVGISLPILMLLMNTENSFIFRINQEFFATEILRSIIGSMAIIITVPISTFLAIKFLGKKEK